MARCESQPFVAAPSAASLSRGDRWIAEALSLLHMTFVAAVASTSGISYLLFPELGALSHDVLSRPWGKWASQPLRLLATPTLTAVVGTLATRHLPYHVLTILLVVCVSLAVIALLRSAVAPALSAGVLPLTLGVKSWLYPPSILFGIAVLVGLSTAWRRRVAKRSPVSAGAPHSSDGDDAAGVTGVMGVIDVKHRTDVRDATDMTDASDAEGVADDVDDVLESAPHGRAWLAALLAFVAAVGAAAQVSGLRFLLFPPLVVIAYEMFGHPETCPWAKRPLSLPLACFLTASGGLILSRFLGTGPLAAACCMAWGVVMLRAFDVHMPPALAVGLIPLVMADRPTWAYPASVGGGTLLLTLAFLLYRCRAARSVRANSGGSRRGTQPVSEG